jgi:hypothetical protein
MVSKKKDDNFIYRVASIKMPISSKFSVIGERYLTIADGIPNSATANIMGRKPK